MKLKITPKFIFTFLALVFVMHEAHELAHTVVGRFICGCWGQRDFNVWGVCEGCTEKKPIAILATFAGPIFTFIMIWIGVFLIEKRKTGKEKTIGFSLIFANLPFARIIGASMGSGDEIWGLNNLLKDRPLAWVLGFLLVLILSVVPLLKAYKLIENKRKLPWFLMFLILPSFVDILIVLKVMNTLLEKGILSDYWILGSPKLVTLWTSSVTVIFLLTKNNIYKLIDK